MHTIRAGRRRWLTVAVLLGALLVPAGARADQYEPNENLARARQVDFTQTIAGAIETENDVDWFMGYLYPGVQVDLLAGLSAERCTIRLYDENGSFVATPYTTPANGRSSRYFVS